MITEREVISVKTGYMGNNSHLFDIATDVLIVKLSKLSIEFCINIVGLFH